MKELETCAEAEAAPKRDYPVPQSEPGILTIVIPAYNEEQSIKSIIQRCLDARERITEQTPAKEVEIIVVSDGSTDKTAELASGYEEVKLIAYEKNRGYGAALKLGFEKAKGDLVSFLDADGTCDPLCFVPMVNKLLNEEGDIVIGNRMAKTNEMPRVRRFGNFLYAKLVSFLSDANITDTASGMRVIRKSSLSRIYPLPNGLHFTPAMTCRAVLCPDLKILEVPIKYAEREGRSKLNVIADGFRFLKTICDIALVYRPMKLFGSVAFLLLLVAAFYSAYPIEYYVANRMINDAMIYRLMAVSVMVLTALLLVSVGVVADNAVDIMGLRSSQRTFFERSLRKLLSQKRLIIAGPIVGLLGVVINWRTIWQYLSTGRINVHWVYIVAGMLLFLAGAQTTCLGLLQRILANLGGAGCIKRR